MHILVKILLILAIIVLVVFLIGWILMFIAIREFFREHDPFM